MWHLSLTPFAARAQGRRSSPPLYNRCSRAPRWPCWNTRNTRTFPPVCKCYSRRWHDAGRSPPSMRCVRRCWVGRLTGHLPFQISLPRPALPLRRFQVNRLPRVQGARNPLKLHRIARLRHRHLPLPRLLPMMTIPLSARHVRHEHERKVLLLLPVLVALMATMTVMVLTMMQGVCHLIYCPDDPPRRVINAWSPRA